MDRQRIALYILLASSATLLLGFLGFLAVVIACALWVYR